MVYDQPSNKKIGRILREIRLEKGFSIAEVADHCDISPATVATLEKNAHRQVDWVEAMADLYGYELDIILKKED